ncbi:hypothetical protein [Larkinella rosea]|uniref:DUF4848 domain-containing protein n=1 Tax=Larkinella rosea TaxID=2025312 RepID=A0A3P1BZA7_9BACT|nr:hypothetical protein [Larkinella rosea]RRB06312.1 hypothetical protein EHT25_00460 [Larkinella rosea]
MKKIIYCIFSFAVLLIATNGCQNSIETAVKQPENQVSIKAKGDRIGIKQSDQLKDLTVKGDYEVRNGILHFKDVNSYHSTEDYLEKLSTEQRVIFSRQIGFTSLLDVDNRANALFEQAKNQDEFVKLLRDYQDLYQLENEMVKPNFNLQHASVLNRQGMVYIGKVLYRFTKDEEIIVFDGDINKALQANTNKYVKKVSLSGNSNPNGRPMASCSRFYHENASSDRKGTCETTFKWELELLEGTGYSPGDVWYVQQVIYTVGLPYKKNWLGSWVRYSTGNTLDTRYQFDFTSPVTNGGVPFSASVNYMYSNTWDSIDYRYLLNSSTEVFGYELPQWQTWTGTLHEDTPTMGYYVNGGIGNDRKVLLKCP